MTIEELIALTNEVGAVTYAHPPSKEVCNVGLSYDQLERFAALVVAKERKSQDKLRAFVAYYVNCPCCNENDKCIDGCTFATDCPDDVQLMEDAREAMRP